MSSRTLARLAVRLALFLLAGAAIALLVAPVAEAGVYNVRECDKDSGNQSPAAPDAVLASSGWGMTPYNLCTDAGRAQHMLGITANGGSAQGHFTAWSLYAPPGTRFVSGGTDVRMVRDGGFRPALRLYGDGAHLAKLADEGANNGSWRRINWTAPASTADQLSLFLTCGASGGCNAGWTTFSEMRQLDFVVEDYTRPAVSIGGSLVSGGDKAGQQTLDVGGSDSGSGVRFVRASVNGTHFGDRHAGCDLTSTGIARRMRPCPASHTGAFTVNTSQLPFREGDNTVVACAYDHATSGSANSACSSRTVRVDTTSPSTPANLTLAGGEDWRPANDFDLSWDASPDNVAGAYYRITGPGGYDSGTQYRAGATTALSDIAVPAKGEFTIKVWLRDQAGNHDESKAAAIRLRFDDTVPPDTEVDFNGWLRRHDFPHRLTWQEVSSSEVGPSGLKGYAVSITRDAVADPCVSEEHPSSECSDTEVNHPGRTEVVHEVSTLPEGEWFAHVVPVSGAGVKAAEIKHTPMPVDMTDPRSSITGVPNRWMNRDVTVSIRALDDLSGMAPDASMPGDPQPRTCVMIESAGEQCQAGDALARTVTAEGVHQIGFWARDLAGNENSGVPEPNGKPNNPPDIATVRIDKTPPSLAFSDRRNADDPSLIRVEVLDALSGIAGGSIELRRRGRSEKWSGLDTRVEQEALTAHVPDNTEAGEYEFRATAVDRAGNGATTNRRADGLRMVEELPLKEAVRLEVRIDGRRARKVKRSKAGSAVDRVTVDYGDPVRLRGTLRSPAGDPLPRHDLTVTERMRPGARASQRAHELKTDRDGRFELRMPAGPSRLVTVRYAGTQRYRRAESRSTMVKVLGRVLRFHAPITVHEDRAMRFGGRIGARGVDLTNVGKLVHLQYEKSPGRFKTIDSGRARKGGRFQIRYALRNNYVQRTKVTFRIVVPRERGWPYAGKAVRSKARTTVILP